MEVKVQIQYNPINCQRGFPSKAARVANSITTFKLYAVRECCASSQLINKFSDRVVAYGTLTLMRSPAIATAPSILSPAARPKRIWISVLAGVWKLHAPTKRVFHMLEILCTTDSDCRTYWGHTPLNVVAPRLLHWYILAAAPDALAMVPARHATTAS